MSSRTTAESLRTSGPFEPSPGYGPAVSSGMVVLHVLVLVVVVLLVAESVVVDVDHRQGHPSGP